MRPGFLSGGLVDRPAITLRLTMERLVGYKRRMNIVLGGTTRGVSDRSNTSIRRFTGGERIATRLAKGVASCLTRVTTTKIVARRRTTETTRLRCILVSVSEVDRLAGGIAISVRARGLIGGSGGATGRRETRFSRRTTGSVRGDVRLIDRVCGVIVGVIGGRRTGRTRGLIGVGRGVHGVSKSVQGKRVGHMRGKGYGTKLATTFGRVLRGIREVKGDYIGLTSTTRSKIEFDAFLERVR